MTLDPANIQIFHITDLENLESILVDGGLMSDVAMAQRTPTVIGHGHIKQRRMTEIRVACAGDRFVGEVVPFYFCARSPMLYTVNKGSTGRATGCQRTILHLVSSVAIGIAQSKPWAISGGNAGAYHTTYSSDLNAMNELDWTAIRATNWHGQTYQKAAEFLVADFFAWTGLQEIGCHNADVAEQVKQMLIKHQHQPKLSVKSSWYY
jgi:hypothetical protein